MGTYLVSNVAGHVYSVSQMEQVCARLKQHSVLSVS